MNRVSTLTSIFLSLCLLTAPEAIAQTDTQLGGRLGFDMNNDTRFLMGLDARFQPAGLPVTINPMIDYHFVGGESYSNFFGSGVDVSTDGSIIQFGAKALYPLEFEGSNLSAYIGAGLIFTRLSLEIEVISQGVTSTESDSDSNLGLGLTGGVVFPGGAMRLFVQSDAVFSGRYEVFGSQTEGGDFLLLTAGVLLSVGE